MPTYTPIQSIQLTSSASSVTFSGIPQIYQDLVLVCNSAFSTSGVTINIRFNEDSGSNYSTTWLYGNGSSAGSGRGSNATAIYAAYIQVGAGTSFDSNCVLSINNYSNSTTYKTLLSRSNVASQTSEASIGLWRSTAAVNSLALSLNTGSISAGSTFDLYGISPVAAQNASAAGGTDIFYDSTYVYHVFKGSGTFTPYRNLTCDILRIAGGGGGGDTAYGGGGGAGGLTASSSQSLTASTSYTVTVGSGGSRGAKGTDSNVTGGSLSLTAAAGGGKGGPSDAAPGTDGNGGCGGGAGGSGGNINLAGGTGSQGYNGGTTSNATPGVGASSGGGGMSAAGGGVTSNGQTTSGSGGVGSSSYSSWGAATSTGHNVGGTYYYCGGGGGGIYSGTAGTGGNGGGGTGSNSATSAISGFTNTGGGGGGSGTTANGGSGGSGLVIIRYAR